jgi:hypothetical protein
VSGEDMGVAASPPGHQPTASEPHGSSCKHGVPDAAPELTHCPFDAGNARLRYDDEFEAHWVGCTTCTARLYADTEAEAVALWNSRVGGASWTF